MQTLSPHTRSVGAFDVRRLLPSASRKTLGPFIFFDHFGPVELPAHQGVDVRPHPHIGLATVTYLFEGAILHRDSLGSVQRIVPGDVNWMTAGKGIVHSERTAAEDLAAPMRLHGLQIWIALPLAFEQTEPSFVHHAAAELPVIDLPGVVIKVILGKFGGAASPVRTYSETLYVAADLSADAMLSFPATTRERAVYVIEGDVAIDGEQIAPFHLAVLPEGVPVEIAAKSATRMILIGGEPLDGERFLWWNFVSSSRERIDVAKADWQARRFGDVPGETEWIPLPER